MNNIRNFSIIAHTPVAKESEFLATGQEVLSLMFGKNIKDEQY